MCVVCFQIQSQIVGSLMTFTQPALQAEETEDGKNSYLFISQISSDTSYL